MDKKVKYLVALIQIVGGALGIFIIGRQLLKGDAQTITTVFHLCFMLLFAYGIVAALALFKIERLGMMLCAIFQAIQIPIITGPKISYWMFSGASFRAYKGALSWGVDFGLFNSSYYLYINSGEPWLFGVNILAVVLFVLLIKELRFSSLHEQYREAQGHTIVSVGQPKYRNDAELYGSPIRLPKVEEEQG